MALIEEISLLVAQKENGGNATISTILALVPDREKG
jgi:hypothetical protein